MSRIELAVPDIGNFSDVEIVDVLVKAGDAIWMAPYCAQWFVAMGKVPARYLYYKDVNRDPFEAVERK